MPSDVDRFREVHSSDGCGGLGEVLGFVSDILLICKHGAGTQPIKGQVEKMFDWVSIEEESRYLRATL